MAEGLERTGFVNNEVIPGTTSLYCIAYQIMSFSTVPVSYQLHSCVIVSPRVALAA
jgi:hypothetical protein